MSIGDVLKTTKIQALLIVLTINPCNSGVAILSNDLKKLLPHCHSNIINPFTPLQPDQRPLMLLYCYISTGGERSRIFRDTLIVLKSIKFIKRQSVKRGKSPSQKFKIHMRLVLLFKKLFGSMPNAKHHRFVPPLCRNLQSYRHVIIIISNWHCYRRHTNQITNEHVPVIPSQNVCNNIHLKLRTVSRAIVFKRLSRLIIALFLIYFLIIFICFISNSLSKDTIQ